MERWNVLVRESTTEHELHFPPWKSEQRTRVWRGSKAEGTNHGSLLARPWGDTAMASLIPVCSNPILGRCQAERPAGAPAPSHQRVLPGDCSSTGIASCTRICSSGCIHFCKHWLPYPSLCTLQTRMTPGSAICFISTGSSSRSHCPATEGELQHIISHQKKQLLSSSYVLFGFLFLIKSSPKINH